MCVVCVTNVCVTVHHVCECDLFSGLAHSLWCQSNFRTTTSRVYVTAWHKILNTLYFSLQACDSITISITYVELLVILLVGC